MKFPWEKNNSIEKVYYPDGSSYVKVNEFLPSIEFRINTYDDLWTLAQIKNVYDHNGKLLNVVIPCLLDAQADRRFKANQPHSLKMVLEFIKSLNFNSVTIFHPHNAEVIEAILPNVKFIDNTRFIELAIDDIWEEQKNLILMSSDAGGFKPLIKLADNLLWKGETYSASKSRDSDTHKLTQLIDRQDFGGKDILIVDDICVYGGTFVGLANLLKERNAGKLYLAVSHMTVTNPNPELEKLYHKIYTTDSKGIKYSIKVKILNFK